MSKFTEGRVGVPGAVNGVFQFVVGAGVGRVFCFGPFSVGVVVHRVYVRAGCRTGNLVGLGMSAALVRTSAGTEENFVAGTGLLQGGGSNVLGQRGYVALLSARNVGILDILAQVEVRDSQVWLALGFEVTEASSFEGFVWAQTMWPGYYGGERSVEIREPEGE